MAALVDTSVLIYSYDAHLWAYAEYHGLDDLLSEDFEHGRLYGSVRVINPFRGVSS